MARKKLKDDWDSVQIGQFHIENNVWNKGNLKNGKDYTQSISYDTKDLSRDLTFSWDWKQANDILAFPEIIAGYKPWSGQGSGAMTEKLSAIKKFILSFDYDISGDTDRFNVAIDMWFTNKPWSGGNNIRTEVKILTHKGDFAEPEGSLVGEYSQGSAFSADIYVEQNYSNNDGFNTWRYITIVAHDDVTRAKLNMDRLLDTLVDMGHLDKKLYFNGYEFGAEHTGGKGRLDIDDISHSIRASARAAEMVETADMPDWLM